MAIPNACVRLTMLETNNLKVEDDSNETRLDDEVVDNRVRFRDI